ncbi:MAG TPA: hypothetical protein VGC13_31405 [Longimicrobium sp.]|jgi:hypothetical protein|uniref:hypothetical protein n=1 Tax=Longimicrobium sp. TaxID=2029185 RepID=UPI002EDA1426
MSDKRKRKPRPQNAERTARAKRRVEKETALIGDLTRPENRNCVYRHRGRLRAELLVYVLRQQLRDDLCYDEGLYEACSSALMGLAARGARRPRAGVLVSAIVRKAVRRAGLPRTGKDFEDFFHVASTMIFAAVESTKAGELLWQERFGMRFRDRLWNVVKLTKREIARSGTPGEGVDIERVHPTVLVARDTPHDLLEAADEATIIREAAAALKRAISRLPHPAWRLAYSVDDVGRLIPNKDAARELDCDPRSIPNYRRNARELLRRDPLLLEELRKIGYRTRSEGE